MVTKRFPKNPFIGPVTRRILPLLIAGAVNLVFFALHNNNHHMADVYVAMGVLVALGVVEITLLVKIKRQAPCPLCGQHMHRPRRAKHFTCPTCAVQWQVPKLTERVAHTPFSRS